MFRAYVSKGVERDRQRGRDREKERESRRSRAMLVQVFFQILANKFVENGNFRLQKAAWE